MSNNSQYTASPCRSCFDISPPADPKYCYIRKVLGLLAHGGIKNCEEDRDIAEHTLQACPAWAEQRRVLVQEIGEDLSLSSVVNKMFGSEEAWSAVVSFCEQVMLQEAAERVRQGEDRHSSSTSDGRPAAAARMACRPRRARCGGHGRGR